MSTLSKTGDPQLALFQDGNCATCRYANEKLVGTGEPCCQRIPWATFPPSLNDEEGKVCLSKRKRDKAFLALQAEAQAAYEYFAKQHQKSDYSQGREGRVYWLDKTPHALLEDNGDRGLLEAIGPSFKDWSIKPTEVVHFEDLEEEPA